LGKVGTISPGELRRFSAALRRIIIEDDLRKIAAGRIGRVYINGPDPSRIVDFANRHKVYMAMVGPLAWGDLVVQSQVIFKPGGGEAAPSTCPMIAVNSDQFRSQPIFYHDGAWIRRGDAIKFIANVGGGVHSGKVDNASDARIAAARETMKIGELDPILLQVLYAGSLIANAPDVGKLEREIWSGG